MGKLRQQEASKHRHPMPHLAALGGSPRLRFCGGGPRTAPVSLWKEAGSHCWWESVAPEGESLRACSPSPALHQHWASGSHPRGHPRGPLRSLKNPWSPLESHRDPFPTPNKLVQDRNLKSQLVGTMPELSRGDGGGGHKSVSRETGPQSPPLDILQYKQATVRLGYGCSHWSRKAIHTVLNEKYKLSNNM